MSQNILIIDDERNIRRTLDMILSGEGYQVFALASGKDALELLQKEHIHMALLDIVMPEIECCHTDKNARPLGRAPPGSCTETIRDSTLRLPSV